MIGTLSNSTLPNQPLPNLSFEWWNLIIGFATLLVVVLEGLPFLLAGYTNLDSNSFESRLRASTYRKQKMEYTILLEVQNQRKNPATHCEARFTVKSQKEADLPPWGILPWIYEDEHRENVGNLTYKGRARIELVKLTVTETALPEGQTSYQYTIGAKQVAMYVTNHPTETVQRGRLRILLDVCALAIYNISIFGDYGVEKHAQLTVELKSKPHLEHFVEL